MKIELCTLHFVFCYLSFTFSFSCHLLLWNIVFFTILVTRWDHLWIIHWWWSKLLVMMNIEQSPLNGDYQNIKIYFVNNTARQPAAPPTFNDSDASPIINHTEQEHIDIINIRITIIIELATVMFWTVSGVSRFWPLCTCMTVVFLSFSSSQFFFFLFLSFNFSFVFPSFFLFS